MATVPTVKIKDGKDFLTINEADFDPDKHKLFVENEKTDDETAEESEETPKKRGK